MNDVLHLDYETRSRIDLLREGVYVYAMSPTTEKTITFSLRKNDQNFANTQEMTNET